MKTRQRVYSSSRWPGIGAVSSLRHVLAGLGCLLALLAGSGGPTAAAGRPLMMICTELDDHDITRVVLELDGDSGAVVSLEVVTPALLWSDPDQPETPRFAAGKTNISPDLVKQDDVAVRTLRDAAGELRIVEFAVTRPDALEVEGFRGSLLLHEGFVNAAALGSLFYSATGNILSVSPVACEKL